MSKSEEKRIRNMNKKFGINQIVKDQVNPLKEAWYFESALDKTILLIIVILAVWKVVGWIF